jgi:uncharacterized protein YjiS (DUF1127 family)
MVSQALQQSDQEEKKLVAADDIAAPISVDVQEHSGWWQRFVDALHRSRMSSARREIARHQDVLALLRRQLAKRREHLHLIADQRSTASTGLADRGIRARNAVGRRVRAAFVTASQTMEEWRRRVRIRNELITLNDGDLRDIGWTRAEVEAERRKPVWRA